MKKVLVSFCFFSVFILCTACASKPKRTMLINTVATSASTNIENAKASSSKGDFEKAEYFLDQAYKMAMSVDNNQVLTAVCLTKVSVYLSENPARLEDAEKALELAKKYAAESSNPQKNLALCTLSQVRFLLAKENADYSKCLEELNSIKSVLSKDLYETAQILSTEAEIYKNQKKYAESEKLYLDAINIFTKECYLSELGINWYKVAQVRSLNGNKHSAIEALNNAIKYDRDAENSNALGSDYYAMAIILLKDKPSEAEIQTAKNALQHSIDIFTASDLEALAQKSILKLEELQ